MTEAEWPNISRELARTFREREAADAESYPAKNIADLKSSGLLLAPLTTAQGGAGAGLRAMAEATEIIAAGSPSTALLTSMPLGLAVIYGLGDDLAPSEYRPAWMKQTETVTAEMRAGMIYAACNSEKGAGGSLAATKAAAVKGPDGEFRITGDKISASFGRHADFFFSTAKVEADDLPGAGIVEAFRVRTDAAGVEVLSDWDGFGMRATESHSVRYTSAPVEGLFGFPNFIETVQPFGCWYCLFAAVPLGCARGILRVLGTPEPSSPALRLRLTEALMRYESLRAYLLETSAAWHPGASPEFRARLLRMKTFVTQEATKLCAELFALSGGRHYRRDGELARLLASSFAGTALRPPLPLALETFVEQFSDGDLG